MNVIRKNILWLLVSQVATWMATLVALVVVPNKLGSVEFGTFGYASGYVMFFTLFASLGTGIYLSRAVARDHSVTGLYVWNAVLLKCVLWVLLGGAAIGSAYAFGNRGQTLLLVAIVSVGMLPYLLNEIFGAALTGMQRIAKPAMWVVVQVYFQTILGILVLVLGGGVVAYTIVFQAAVLIPLVATALMVRPFVRSNRTFDFGVWRLLVVGGVPLLALTFLNLLYGTLDVPILHHFVGSEPVGWYVVALRWVAIPIFITTAVVAAYFPSFSYHGKPVTDLFAPLVNRAIYLVLLVTIPASLGLFFISDDIIHFLYGHDYDSSIVLIQILTVGIPIVAMDTVLVTSLVASNRVNRYLAVAAAAAVLNPVACVFAIPYTDTRFGNGAIGASVVTVLTELWVMGGALLFRAPGVVDRTEVGRILRIMAAALAMVPVLILSRTWPLPVQVVLGVAAYALASLAFGSVTIAELRDMIQQTLQARRPNPSGESPDDDETDDGLATVPHGGDPQPLPEADHHPRP